MANIDFDTTPLMGPSDTKIFGTVETSVEFATTFGEDLTLKRALLALQRGPARFYRDNVIACDGDVAEYMFFVVSGVVRSCKVFESGSRNVVAFYLPGDLLGWSDLKHSLSIEAATDTQRSCFLNAMLCFPLQLKTVGLRVICCPRRPISLNAHMNTSF